jgi:putative FmdB family regulatory protein
MCIRRAICGQVRASMVHKCGRRKMKAGCALRAIGRRGAAAGVAFTEGGGCATVQLAIDDPAQVACEVGAVSFVRGFAAMPIFEYRCRACRHQFDALQKIGDAPLITCPECRRQRLEKLLSTPAFHLSGTGWRSPSAAGKAASGAGRTPRRIGHILDSGPPHTHDDDGGHSSGSGHTHSHGDVTHTHGQGHKHDHKK